MSVFSRMLSNFIFVTNLFSLPTGIVVALCDNIAIFCSLSLLIKTPVFSQYLVIGNEAAMNIV